MTHPLTSICLCSRCSDAAVLDGDIQTLYGAPCRSGTAAFKFASDDICSNCTNCSSMFGAGGVDKIGIGNSRRLCIEHATLSSRRVFEEAARYVRLLTPDGAALRGRLIPVQCVYPTVQCVSIGRSEQFQLAGCALVVILHVSYTILFSSHNPNISQHVIITSYGSTTALV